MATALAVAMNDESPVQLVECRTADEFLDSLSPRGKYFREGRSPESYVFRGHADQRYQLVPTALRLGEQIASQGLPARLTAVRRITVVTAPMSSNPNLRAQRGVFTLFRNEKVLLGAPTDREPMDCVVRKLSEQHNIYNKLIESSLPIAESPKLLRLLAREGIDAATLFPGYFGVAKALKENRYWASPQ
jgi:hypothetical protein